MRSTKTGASRQSWNSKKSLMWKFWYRFHHLIYEIFFNNKCLVDCPFTRYLNIRLCLWRHHWTTATLTNRSTSCLSANHCLKLRSSNFAKKQRKYSWKSQMFSQYEHQSLSVEISMDNSMIWWNCSRLEAGFPTPTTFSWATMSIEVNLNMIQDTIVSRQSHCCLPSKSGSVIGSPYWEEITSRDRSPRFMVSTMNAQGSMVIPMSGNALQIYSTSYLWQQLLKTSSSAFTEDCHPQSKH